MRQLALVALALLALAPTSEAQTLRAPRPPAFLSSTSAVVVEQANVVNPVTAEFAPSLDHATSALTRYLIEIYTSAGTLARAAVDLGKPTPVSGKITITLPAATLSGLATGVDYTAKIVAEGPGGQTRSAASNPFDVALPPRASGTPILR